MAEEHEHEGEETNLVKQLRKEIKDRNDRIADLEGKVRSNVFERTFTDYGLDPTKGPGKFVADAYKGELDEQAVRGWLQNEGFEPAEQQQPSEPEPGLAQRVAAEQRSQQVREHSTSGTPQRMGWGEYQQMLKTDPHGAVEAHRQGRVEIPPHLQGAAIPPPPS